MVSGYLKQACFIKAKVSQVKHSSGGLHGIAALFTDL
jgi:hypothetical protein